MQRLEPIRAEWDGAYRTILMKSRIGSRIAIIGMTDCHHVARESHATWLSGGRVDLFC